MSAPLKRQPARDQLPPDVRALRPLDKIDVMFLYSDASLTRVVNGATAAQMESLIANELPKATEAAVNSDIDLQFNLVHAGPVSD